VLELLIASSIASATPLLYATVGEILTERSGVLNLGVEGMMTVGALSGFATAVMTGSSYLGLLCASWSAGLLSLIHAFLSVTLRANQIVSGLGLTIFGIGLTGYLGQSMIGKPAPAVLLKTFLPYLSEMPFLGQAFFQQSPLVYVGVVLALLAYFFLFHTRTGLNLRAVGENPAAADMAGVNVFLIRYAATFAGGALCGLGGAYVSLVYTPFWTENMIAGRGWIAIALVIFASWDPRLAIAGAFLFGGVDALATRFQALGVGIPSYFLRMLPYAFTILILIFSFVRRETRSGLSVVPASLTIPYEREG
jgi:general nucleoside transport system permease protein